VRSASLALALSLTALACHSSDSDASNADVYVPAPPDAGADGPVVPADSSLALGQVDRAGRPLVSVLLVPGALQDLYNEQPSFSTSVSRTTAGAIETRLVELDTLVLDGGADGDPVDWPVPDGGTHPLLPMFVQDVLFVDTGRSCLGKDGGYVTSYLDLEREIFLASPPHQTCGGRTPDEAVVDETLQLLVTGDRDGGPVVTQGVPGPTRLATTTFPYLAPPN
jgi:hypothetical protein